MLQPHETEILQLIRDRAKNEVILSKFQNLLLIPYQKHSSDFLNDPEVKEFLIEYCENAAIQFWFLTACYLICEEHLKEEKFLEIQDFFENSIKSYDAKFDPTGDTLGFENYDEEAQSGCQMFLGDKISQSVIINIYKSNDENLISLLEQNKILAKPTIFSDGDVPKIVSEREIKRNKETKQFIEKNRADPAKNENDRSLEQAVISVQRQIRRNRRREEEINRLNFFHPVIEKRKLNPEQLLDEANTMYTPKCSKDLSERIVAITKKLDLHSTIRHLTAENALLNIFNECLYGRRNLTQSFMPYKKAALQLSDIRNGDGNVICFGFQDIDPQAVAEIEIVLDLKKAMQSRPAAFYKVLDLEFMDEKIRDIPIGNEHFYFSISKSARLGADSPMNAFFQVWNSTNGGIKEDAVLPKYEMIAYDTENITQILILKFFKFIDNLKSVSAYNPETTTSTQLYYQLSQLNDEELECFLTDVSREFTKTGEFNFYGAYQIDFNSLLEIKNVKARFSLNMKAFISSLNAENLTALSDATKHFPTLFESYRFLDYLISQITNEISKNSLEEMRQKCKTPDWLDGEHDNDEVNKNKEIPSNSEQKDYQIGPNNSAGFFSNNENKNNELDDKNQSNVTKKV